MPSNYFIATILVRTHKTWQPYAVFLYRGRYLLHNWVVIPHMERLAAWNRAIALKWVQLRQRN